MASHLTAARWYGFPVPSDGVVHAIVPPTLRSVPGLRAHSGALLPGDVRRLPWGPSVTTRARTGVDCLAWLPFPTALDLLAWLTSRDVVTGVVLAEAIRRRTGRHGTPQLLRLLRLTGHGGVSVAELRLHRLFEEHGLAGWVAGARIHDGLGLVGVVDVLFPGERVVIEVDGWVAHSFRGAFVADRRRQNRLVAAGYRVLRVTWDDLTQRPDELIREILDVLEPRRQG